MTFTAKLLGATAATALLTSGAIAGGLDRSGQPTSIIFKDGRYLEFSGAFVMPDVSGTITGGGRTGNGQNDYQFFGIGYKADINDQLSYAVILDEPYGSDVEYGPGLGSPFNGLEGEVNSQALTALLRYELGNGFSVHGGLRAQQADANAFIPAALLVPFPTDYSVRGDADVGYGAVLGFAYEKPEIALRVAMTYSTSIEHDVDYQESLGGASSGTLEFPESVNLEFQSGVNQSTLVFGSIRWANYSDFTISPPNFTTTLGRPLVSYADDAWSYDLGVARRITPDFVATVAFGYEASNDSANPSPFSPADGRRSISVAGIYTVGNAEITAGVRYTDLGDETIPLGAAAQASFRDNDAISVGIRVGFKL